MSLVTSQKWYGKFVNSDPVLLKAIVWIFMTIVFYLIIFYQLADKNKKDWKYQLKVSTSRKQIMKSRILPKNERNPLRIVSWVGSS